MIALICYHKNAEAIYPIEWIKQFRNSVLEQTFTEYKILEIDYGGGDFKIFENSIYESNVFPTFVHAMNHLLSKAILLGHDCVGNLNCDDVYSTRRLEMQLPYIDSGYDLVSSNFSLLKDDIIIKEHVFSELNIKDELAVNHNPIAHPSVIYSRNFLENNRYVPEELPLEDLLLWKRTINDYKFKIVPENLLYHRIHNNSVCQSLNR